MTSGPGILIHREVKLVQPGACLTLLFNTVEENLRGMTERMKERKNE